MKQVACVCFCLDDIIGDLDFRRMKEVFFQIDLLYYTIDTSCPSACFAVDCHCATPTWKALVQPQVFMVLGCLHPGRLIFQPTTDNFRKENDLPNPP